MSTYDEKYWTQRYRERMTGWDMGRVSPPIASYVDQLEDRAIDVIVPGAGNGYEVEYLWKAGFSKVHLLDISMAPLQNFRERVPGFPAEQLLHQDFFEHRGTYDLILEQTFFSALEPTMRDRYARKVNDLLKPGGKLVGLLFSVPMSGSQPTYGGSEAEYRELFSTYFQSIHMEPCYNSIEPRLGSELFFKLVK